MMLERIQKVLVLDDMNNYWKKVIEATAGNSHCNSVCMTEDFCCILQIYCLLRDTA